MWHYLHNGVQLVYSINEATPIEIISLILSIIAVGFAIWLGFRQMDLSKQQGKIIDRQTELLQRQHDMMVYTYNVDNQKYILDNIVSNQNQLIMKVIYKTIAKYGTNNVDEVNKFTDEIKGYENSIDDLYTDIQTSFDSLDKTLENKPKRSKYETF